MRTTRSHGTGDPLRLLIASGGGALGAKVARALLQLGLRADCVRWGGDLQHHLRTWDYACVLLAFDLPDLPGEAALRAVRDVDATKLVICVTGPLDAAARIRLLDAGADDHLMLPIDAAEIAAHVRAVTRRIQRTRAAAADLIHGPLSLRIDRRSASWHGREVPLTNMEFWLLETLVRRKHQALSRAEIEELVYRGEEQAGSNTVEVHVHHLRRKFDRRLIVTRRGVGYQIGAEADLTSRP